MIDGRLPTILLFGAPGVGKGTQGAILGRIPGYFHLSCGEVFRSLNIQSPEGREIYEYSSKGQLVPNDLTIRIWKKSLDGHIALSHFKPPYEFLILDGIPQSAAGGVGSRHHPRAAGDPSGLLQRAIDDRPDQAAGHPGKSFG